MAATCSLVHRLVLICYVGRNVVCRVAFVERMSSLRLIASDDPVRSTGIVL
jgi:hypothetical protein